MIMLMGDTEVTETLLFTTECRENRTVFADSGAYARVEYIPYRLDENGRLLGIVISSSVMLSFGFGIAFMQKYHKNEETGRRILMMQDDDRDTLEFHYDGPQ